MTNSSIPQQGESYDSDHFVAETNRIPSSITDTVHILRALPDFHELFFRVQDILEMVPYQNHCHFVRLPSTRKYSNAAHLVVVAKPAISSWAERARAWLCPPTGCFAYDLTHCGPMASGGSNGRRWGQQ